MSESQKYRRQVEALDRRRRLAMRAVVAIGSAGLAALGLWSAGVNPLGWLAHLHYAPALPATARSPVVLKPHRVIRAGGEERAHSRLGTDASASRAVQHLHLVRTIPGRNAHAGQALLGVDRAHPQTYLAGAILASGARIEAIYRDHIVLAKGAQRSALYVDGAGQADGHPSADDALLAVGGAPAPVAQRRLSTAPLAAYVRAAPVYTGGAVTGLAVYPGAHSGPFRTWGLKAGDVITALDGQPLADAGQANALLAALMQGQAMTATVRRAGGETVEVALDGQALARLEAARRTAQTSAPPPMPGGPLGAP